MKNYFRKEISGMSGYVPGEQPKMDNLVKLNTNENPYPPSPAVAEVLRTFDSAMLRRYPDPMADQLRDAIAARFGARRSNIVIGNGSDDILTMVFRAFTAPGLPMAMLRPSYSLYAELAAMQGARVIDIRLELPDFSLPENLLETASDANLLIITRPNAPTGNSFSRILIENICRKFDGMVLIDEAYADFADDNCMDFALRFDNVIVMRTFSKSYSLAGIRLGYAVASEPVVEGLMKLKDSYNSDALAQAVGLAAFMDREHLENNCRKIIAERSRLTAGLRGLGFAVVESQSNFLFASPCDGDGGRCFEELRRRAVVTRYFPGETTGRYVRITVGSPAENDRVLECLREIYAR
ncbi:MAG: histidinol-phosphate transaminase [Victivallaceae bacterium]|nr:histidinol-phosphate transaminase [Victivallaceae bacterium]